MQILKLAFPFSHRIRLWIDHWMPPVFTNRMRIMVQFQVFAVIWIISFSKKFRPLNAFQRKWWKCMFLTSNIIFASSSFFFVSSILSSVFYVIVRHLLRTTSHLRLKQYKTHMKFSSKRGQKVELIYFFVAEITYVMCQAQHPFPVAIRCHTSS